MIRASNRFVFRTIILLLTTFVGLGCFQAPTKKTTSQSSEGVFNPVPVSVAATLFNDCNRDGKIMGMDQYVIKNMYLYSSITNDGFTMNDCPSLDTDNSGGITELDRDTVDAEYDDATHVLSCDCDQNGSITEQELELVRHIQFAERSPLDCLAAFPDGDTTKAIFDHHISAGDCQITQ